MEIVLLALAGDFLLVIAVGKVLAFGSAPAVPVASRRTVPAVPSSLSGSAADFEAWELHFSSV